jgi:hypothetical protein
MRPSQVFLFAFVALAAIEVIAVAGFINAGAIGFNPGGTSVANGAVVDTAWASLWLAWFFGLGAAFSALILFLISWAGETLPDITDRSGQALPEGAVTGEPRLVAVDHGEVRPAA